MPLLSSMASQPDQSAPPQLQFFNQYCFHFIPWCLGWVCEYAAIGSEWGDNAAMTVGHEGIGAGFGGGETAWGAGVLAIEATTNDVGGNAAKTAKFGNSGRVSSSYRATMTLGVANNRSGVAKVDQGSSAGVEAHDTQRRRMIKEGWGGLGDEPEVAASIGAPQAGRLVAGLTRGSSNSSLSGLESVAGSTPRISEGTTIKGGDKSFGARRGQSWV